MYASKVISGLAIVGFAAAASSTSASSSSPTQCSQPTATVNSQSDLTNLQDCTTFTGDLVISSTASGILTLTGIGQIVGSLIANGSAGLTSLVAPTLNSISQEFNLVGLTTLTNLQFTELTSVDSIVWNNLPALSALTFPAVVTQASNVNIQDTQLTSLTGINLNTVDTMLISNNRFLTSISTGITNVTTSLEIDSNGLSLMVNLPSLNTSGGDLTFRNTSGVSIPALTAVNGVLTFLSNTFDSISAPNLTSVTGLSISANPNLANISMNALSEIGGGGITVQNNSALVTINGFNSVTKDSGTFDFLGNFTTLSFPKLGQVGGAFVAKSSGNFSCDEFDKLNSENEILSTTYTCDPSTNDVSNDNSTSGSSTGTSTGSSPSATSSKKSSAEMLNAPIALGLVGGLLAMLL
jgi:hypothetical protein